MIKLSDLNTFTVHALLHSLEKQGQNNSAFQIRGGLFVCKLGGSHACSAWCAWVGNVDARWFLFSAALGWLHLRGWSLEVDEAKLMIITCDVYLKNNWKTFKKHALSSGRPRTDTFQNFELTDCSSTQVSSKNVTRAGRVIYHVSYERSHDVHGGDSHPITLLFSL